MNIIAAQAVQCAYSQVLLKPLLQEDVAAINSDLTDKQVAQVIREAESVYAQDLTADN